MNTSWKVIRDKIMADPQVLTPFLEGKLVVVVVCDVCVKYHIAEILDEEQGLEIENSPCEPSCK